jgi:hypothetical protein
MMDNLGIRLRKGYRGTEIFTRAENEQTEVKDNRKEWESVTRRLRLLQDHRIKDSVCKTLQQLNPEDQKLFGLCSM